MKNSIELSALSECIAYIPVYYNGNSVLTVDKCGGKEVVDIGIRPLINRLLKARCIDARSLKRNFSNYVGRTNLLPIPLGIDRVLIPVKMRKPIGVNDGAFGYIDLSYIEEVGGDNTALIKLKCAYEISCLETTRTVKNRMKMGDTVGERFTSRMVGQFNIAEGALAVSSEYNQPATKGDITILAYEIMKLRKTLRGGHSSDSHRFISQKEEECPLTSEGR